MKRWTLWKYTLVAPHQGVIDSYGFKGLLNAIYFSLQSIFQIVDLFKFAAQLTDQISGIARQPRANEEVGKIAVG